MTPSCEERVRRALMSWPIILMSCGTSTPPNILIVTLDTTRADVIGAYGSSAGATPFLDEFAKESTLFSRAFTVTPLTIPAHSSLFTGMWPPRHGVRDNGDFFLGDGATTLAERLHAAGYATMAAVGAEVTSHHWGFAQGFDAFFDDMGQSTEKQSNRWRVERRGDSVIADAESWLSTHETEGKPWLAWVHLYDNHHPYRAPEPYASRHSARPYLAEVAYTDTLVASLLGSLKDRGVLDQTWVFIVADHGEGLGSHGESFHGVLLYDATTRIPMMVRPPKGNSAQVVDFPVSLVDILPTALSAAGVPVPGGLDGIDLSPWISGDAKAPEGREVYAESLYAQRHYGWAPQRVLVDADYKLIDSTTPELYAKNDGPERNDLASTEPYRLTAMETALGKLTSAMTPESTTTDRVEVSVDRMAQLAALGYVTGLAETDPTLKGAPDPVTQLPILRRVERAREALNDGDLAEARKQLEGVIAADPGLVEPQVLLATILLRQEDFAGALAVADAVDARQPLSNVKALRATIHVRMGDPAKGADLFREALDLDPYLATAWVPYLQVLYMMGDLRSVEKEVDRAVRLLPDAPGVIGMQGVLLVQRGELDAGGRALEKAVADDAGLPWVNQALGQIARARGEADKAETFFSSEVALHPPGIQSRRYLVEMYSDQRRYDEQLAELEEIAKTEPPHPLTLHSKAQALFNLERYEDAKAVVDACRELAPKYKGCAMLEANVWKKLGNEAKAQAAYEEALALAEDEKAARQ